MSEEKIDKLIELNEKIVSQNDEIINLLKQLNSSDEEITADTELPEEKSEAITKEVNEYFNNGDLDEGEVLFVANSQDNQIDIYKLGVKKSDELIISPSQIEKEILNNFDDLNYEITLENLTGNGLTSQFKVPLLVAIESINNNQAIQSNICVLDDESFINLPDLLRVAIENKAENVYLPMKNSIAVIQAPPMIMDYLSFYKNNDDLLEQLFEKKEC
ncbi:hypothetical protein [Methanobrevibacter sp.]|uniref:hypothetical protein n=1 Tax=Methanobrevibacter sp. TaxID=66852 RepID=UPI0025CED804|nr:hypothetical protein [Methanobrevibacter sp.]MEE0025327.1 hypothetical protein [Methanobrevibacter sp.]